MEDSTPSGKPVSSVSKHQRSRGTQNKTPEKYVHKTKQVTDKILERIADGDSLAAICREDGYPTQKAFYLWLEQDGELLQRYARARERQADTLADNALEHLDRIED